MLYTEPSQEVGYSKPSVLVTDAAEVDPEVKVMYRSFNPTFVLALMVILLQEHASFHHGI